MTRYDDRSRKLARERYWDKHDKETYKCPDCGRGQGEIVGEFQVHHKSRNPHDNRLERLIGLCGYCHRLREGKKPSLQRLRKLRDNNSKIADAHIHEFVQSFIDERLCLCSEGRDYAWFDVIQVHYSALDEHLKQWGYEINDKFRTDLISAYRLLPETRISFEMRHDADSAALTITISGPDANGRRACDCLSSKDLSRDNRFLGDWR
ncbi:putative HNH endonuclease [environmental Halophage eHP-14]|nr:putative HNH endonuclease [environmental Halophage eHP-14]